MAPRLVYAAIAHGPRKIIHALRVAGETLEWREIDELAAKLREHLLARHGEQFADVVIIQGDSKETLRLYGETYSVSQVRAAMFHGAVKWRPIALG